MTTNPPTLLRLGTRGSLLAKAQSQLVADQLQTRHPDLRVELTIVTTTGDRILDRPLNDIGGKGLFTKELEQALLRNEIDFAVHSFKDVPITMPLVEQSNLVVAAVPLREDPRDVLITATGATEFPAGGNIGTSSLRRRCQILELAPTARIESIRGNIDTRLRKLRDGEFDAVVMALAGLRRAGLFDEKTMHILPVEAMLPAPGQGALALQCRADDARTRNWLQALNHPPSAQAVRLERAVVAGLNGDCHSPIAVWAMLTERNVLLRAAVGGRDGSTPVLRASSGAPIAGADNVVRALLESLERAGARQRLSG